MKNLSKEAEKIMTERFGKDTVIALATVENEVPYVRYVNACYENGVFYIITYALSNKTCGKQFFYCNSWRVVHSTWKGYQFGLFWERRKS